MRPQTSSSLLERRRKAKKFERSGEPSGEVHKAAGPGALASSGYQLAQEGAGGSWLVGTHTHIHTPVGPLVQKGLGSQDPDSG